MKAIWTIEVIAECKSSKVLFYGFYWQNLKRVVEVWMDEYAEYVYQRRPEYRHLSAGDMIPQKELRSRLGCKTFKWFMSNVAWDLSKHYPPVEPPAAAWGEVRLTDKVDRQGTKV